MNIAQLESFIFDKMSATRLPGLSIAVVKDAQVVYARAFGVADIGRCRPATPTTLYGAASITKSFVAIAILQLVEKGLLKLDEPVTKYVHWPKNRLGEVKIEHLLTHTSGLCALAYIEGILRHAHGIGGKNLPIGKPADVFTFMQGAEQWVETAPGERWFYLNEGYVALGEIIAKLTGRPYELYLAEHVLKPLGMTRSFFTEADVNRDGELAACYVLPNDGKPPRPGRYLFNALGGDAALFTSVLDLAKYCTMFMNRGRGVLSEASYDAMIRGRVNLPACPSPELFGGERGPDRRGMYGLGVTVGDFLGDRLVAHTGSLITSTGFFGVMPKSQLGVAILANGNGYPLATLGKAALAVMNGQSPGEITPIKIADRLTELTGRYETFKGSFQARVSKRGDFLLVDYPGGDQPAGSTILVPECYGDGVAQFFTYSDGAKLASTFRSNNGTIEWVHERYKMRRVGPL